MATSTKQLSARQRLVAFAGLALSAAVQAIGFMASGFCLAHSMAVGHGLTRWNR